MSKRTKGRKTIYHCDHPGCRATFVADTRTWAIAWRMAKAAGWVSANLGDKWFHWCDWVHRPSAGNMDRIMQGSQAGFAIQGKQCKDA